VQQSLPIKCAIGFAFDLESNKCKLSWDIAGKWNKTEKLTVLCPVYPIIHIFDNQTNTCVAGVGPVAVISSPIVCNSGYKIDGNGNCREAW